MQRRKKNSARSSPEWSGCTFEARRAHWTDNSCSERRMPALLIMVSTARSRRGVTDCARKVKVPPLKGGVGVATGLLQRLLELAPRDVDLGGAPYLLACHRRGHDCVALQTNRDRNHWWHGAGRRSKRAARRALAMLPEQKRRRIKTDYRGDGMRWIALLSSARALGRRGRVASGRRRSNHHARRVSAR
jgi:hypothetical protein